MQNYLMEIETNSPQNKILSAILTCYSDIKTLENMIIDLQWQINNIKNSIFKEEEEEKNMQNQEWEQIKNDNSNSNNNSNTEYKHIISNNEIDQRI